MLRLVVGPSFSLISNLPPPQFYYFRESSAENGKKKIDTLPTLFFFAPRFFFALVFWPDNGAVVGTKRKHFLFFIPLPTYWWRRRRAGWIPWPIAVAQRRPTSLHLLGTQAARWINHQHEPLASRRVVRLGISGAFQRPQIRPTPSARRADGHQLFHDRVRFVRAADHRAVPIAEAEPHPHPTASTLLILFFILNLLIWIFFCFLCFFCSLFLPARITLARRPFSNVTEQNQNDMKTFFKEKNKNQYTVCHDD